jgi:hypothetical protein
MEENNNQSPGRLSPSELLEQLKITTEALRRESSQLNSSIPGIDKKLKESGELIDRSLKELKSSVVYFFVCDDIRLGIGSIRGIFRNEIL